MADPYYRYNTASAAAADGGSVSRSRFPVYFSPEPPSLAPHHADKQVASSDKNQLQPERYGVDDISSSGYYRESDLGGVPDGATRRAYPSSIGDSNLTGQRWDAPPGVSSNMGVNPEPSFGAVSAAAPVRDYSSSLEVPSLVGHRQEAPRISPRAGVHPEPGLGAVPAAAAVKGYSSALEVPNLVGQRRDIGALSSGASIKGYSSTLEDPRLVGQRRDAPISISPITGVQHDSNLSAMSDGASMGGYSSPVEGPKLAGQRLDGPLGIRCASVDEKPASMRNGEGPLDAAEESNILFVDGLPTDCTRREVGHLFRPFLGYKDIKVVHKEPRRSGDRAMVMCFVEFDEPKFAMTAMQALQGYKFDDKKPDSPVLKIQFAHFPFRFRDGCDDKKVESRRR